MLLPGTAPAAYRLRGFSGDVQAEVMTALRSTTRGPKVARRLLRLRSPAARTPLRAGEPRTPVEPPVPPSDGGHPDVVLARTVAAGLITTAEADLIGATRLEDVSAADFADRPRTRLLGVAEERSRAEERLISLSRTWRSF
ncbi:hypothetical protein [Micromonospora sp. L5]|uniref:hypothetical protein n=1 Tax=Micromonospora sp. (strain L5) TaxID=648999 RepID=UPI00117E9A83